MEAVLLQPLFLLGGIVVVLVWSWVLRWLFRRRDNPLLVGFARLVLERERSRSGSPARDEQEEGRVDQLPIGCAVIGWLALGLVLVTATGYGLYWVVGRPRPPAVGEFKISELLDLIKLGLAVVAGVGGVVALTVTYRKQKVAEAAHVLALGQEVRDRERAYNERYIAASEQLGSDKFFVRLTGAYAMIGLAEDWDEQRQVCLNILADYLRVPFPEDDPGEALVRKRIVYGLLSRTSSRSYGAREDVIDLSGVELHDLDLSGLEIHSRVVFDNVVFRGDVVDFSGVVFHSDVSFEGAVFKAASVSFAGAQVRNRVRLSFSLSTVDCERLDFRSLHATNAVVDFTAASVRTTRIDFDDTFLTGSTLALSGIGLEDARLGFAEAVLGRSNLVLDGAHLQRCELDLSPCTLSSGVLDLDDATLVDCTARTEQLSVQGCELRTRGLLLEGSTDPSLPELLRGDVRSG